MSQAQWEEVDFEKASATYPGIPSTVLVKIEARRRGLKLTPAAQKAIQEMDIITPDYQPFSSVFDEQESQAAQRVKITGNFCLRKDDTLIGFSQNSNSPYTVDIRNNRFFFTDDRLRSTPLEEAYFVPQPKSWSRTFPDGTPYQKVIFPQGLDMFTFSVRHSCDFWRAGDRCNFCNLEVKRKGGLKVSQVAPQVAAKAIKEVFENEPRYRHLNISGGTILDAEKEADFYCTYLNAINEAFGGVWYPATFKMVAREEKYLKRIYETGVPVIHLDKEVWDERMFNIICPGKAKLIGHEEWIKRAIKGVDIFGWRKVAIDFVAGVEMAQPWGFKDAHSAVKNTLGGADFLMEHGVIPVFRMWRTLEHGSALAGQASPPLEYYIELFRGFMELLEKHKFGYPGPARCRACSSDPEIDWWYYLHKEEPTLKAVENANRKNS